MGVLTKHLPIELFGSYNKVFNYLGIFAFLADLWLYAITIREISQKRVSSEKIIWNVLTLRTWMWFLIWAVAFAVAFFLPGYNTPLMLTAIFIVWAFTLVSLINSSLLALMQSQMKMEFSLISIVSWKLLNLFWVILCLMVFFTDAAQSSEAFIWVFIIAFLGISLNTFLNYLYARRLTHIRYRFEFDYIKHIFKIALPYGIALFLSVVYFKVDIVLLSLLEAPEKADISIALYSLPMKIVEVLMVLGGFYLNSLLPTLTEKFEQKKYSDISHILSVSLKFLISFWILIFILWNIFSHELISLFATSEYLSPGSHEFSSQDVLSLVVWVLLFHFISLCFIYILIASHRQSLLLWINFWVTCFNIVWNIALIPHYSFMWAAIITLLSQILLMWITGVIVLQKIPLKREVLAHISWSVILASVLYFVSTHVLSVFSLGTYVSLFVVGPIIVSLYAAWEYIVSRKLFLNH